MTTTSQVFSLKWRPQRFQDVVGQGPVVQTLREAVAQGRAAHAYLFAGPRGTGKTSTARIMAKAMNCHSLAPGSPANQDEATRGEPDNTCPFCVAVAEGRALDLVEMDAASHRGIDDVRSLRERAFGAGPAEGRCKVYIIDEAHMLTEPAFNALLKTLEEPAPWAYFILCTTEAHKIPATILSRCQRFDFRRITSADLMGRLERICREEGIEAEPEALRTIARVSWGSLRDACNILEQTVTSHGSHVALAHVQELLGLTQDTKALEVARCALTGDAPGGLRLLQEAVTAGTDLRAFHRDLVEYLRTVLLRKGGVEAADLDYPAEVLEEIRALADRTAWPALLKTVQLFGEVNLRAGEVPGALPLELALVEAASLEAEAPRPATAVREEAPAPARTAPSPPVSQGRAPSPARPARQESAAPAPPSPSTASEPAPAAPSPAAPSPSTVSEPAPAAVAPASTPAPSAPSPGGAGAGAISEAQWTALYQTLRRVKGQRYVLGPLLLDCQDHYIDGETLVLHFKNRANRDRLEGELDHPPSHRAVQEAMETTLGRRYELRLTAAEAAPPGQSGGHLLRAAMAMGARIIPEEETQR